MSGLALFLPSENGTGAAYSQVKEPSGEKPGNSIRTLCATDQNVAERKRTKLYIACITAAAAVERDATRIQP